MKEFGRKMRNGVRGDYQDVFGIHAVIGSREWAKASRNKIVGTSLPGEGFKQFGRRSALERGEKRWRIFEVFLKGINLLIVRKNLFFLPKYKT